MVLICSNSPFDGYQTMPFENIISFIFSAFRFFVVS